MAPSMCKVAASNRFALASSGVRCQVVVCPSAPYRMAFFSMEDSQDAHADFHTPVGEVEGFLELARGKTALELVQSSLHVGQSGFERFLLVLDGRLPQRLERRFVCPGLNPLGHEL